MSLGTDYVFSLLKEILIDLLGSYNPPTGSETPAARRVWAGEPMPVGWQVTGLELIVIRGLVANPGGSTYKGLKTSDSYQAYLAEWTGASENISAAQPAILAAWQQGPVSIIPIPSSDAAGPRQQVSVVLTDLYPGVTNSAG